MIAPHIWIDFSPPLHGWNVKPYSMNQAIFFLEWNSFINFCTCFEAYLNSFHEIGFIWCVYGSFLFFSIFRLTNETEALNKFRQFSSIINPLAHASSSVYDENLLQKISDIINMYPSWRPVLMLVYMNVSMTKTFSGVYPFLS